jgi:hypothetical protein
MKKHFPEGTFAATPLRVLSILQLCIVFTYIAWVGGYPFLGEIYEVKAARSKYETVLKNSFYEELSKDRKALIISGYEEILDYATEPFLVKTERCLRIILQELPVYTKIWIILSILLSVFILLRIDGAIPCVWLLPLSIGYGFMVHLGQPYALTYEERLFPTESVLIKDYLKKPLDGGLSEQREQLQQAWDMYLKDAWAGPGASLEKGRFLFNVARVEAMMRDGIEKRGHTGAGEWLLFFIWNIGWAVGVVFFDYWTRRKKNHTLVPQP